MPRTWTDDDLRNAIAASASYEEVCERLGIGNEEVERVKRRASHLRIERRHLVRRGPRKRETRWSDDDLRNAVTGARSIAQVLRALGLVPAGGNYDHVQRRIRALGLDTSHLLGTAWNRGGSSHRPALPLEQVLVAGRWTGSHKLKRRLLRAGLKTEACERCGWCERAPDGRVPLELDHVNGDKTDNRLENLRILCPNCHALQPTHRGLNQRRRAR